MASKTLNPDLLERFRSMDLHKDLLIVSNREAGSTYDFTKNQDQHYNMLLDIKSKVENAIEHIGEGASGELVSKVEILISKFISLVEEVKKLNVYRGDGTTTFDSEKQRVVDSIYRLSKGLQDGDDELKVSHALNKLQLQYLQNIVQGKGLDEKMEKAEEDAKTIKTILQDVSKVTATGGIQELGEVSNDMKSKYSRTRGIFLGAGIIIGGLLLVVSLCGRHSIIELVNSRCFEYYKLLQFIPMLLIYTIGFYALSFCIKEYKKSDIMYIFNENKESIAKAFTLLNARDRTDKDQEIKRDLFGKTIDGLYKVPDSIYTASTDGFVHEKIIEKVIDKIPTGGSN